MASRPAVFADASVLYSAVLRDILIQAALEKALTLHWSAEVQAEWRRALLTNRPDLDAAKVTRTQRPMNEAPPSAAVDGFQAHIAKLTLPDPKDRHVLAAAIHSECDVIVTFNLADFPASVLALHGIATMHPDAFFGQIFEDTPLLFVNALLMLRLRLKAPSYTVEELLLLLARHRLNATVEALRPLLGLL